jgi:hypothetical protein
MKKKRKKTLASIYTMQFQLASQTTTNILSLPVCLSVSLYLSVPFSLAFLLVKQWKSWAPQQWSFRMHEDAVPLTMPTFKTNQLFIGRMRSLSNRSFFLCSSQKFRLCRRHCTETSHSFARAVRTEWHGWILRCQKLSGHMLSSLV